MFVVSIENERSLKVACVHSRSNGNRFHRILPAMTCTCTSSTLNPVHDILTNILSFWHRSLFRRKLQSSSRRLLFIWFVFIFWDISIVTMKQQIQFALFFEYNTTIPTDDTRTAAPIWLRLMVQIKDNFGKVSSIYHPPSQRILNFHSQFVWMPPMPVKKQNDETSSMHSHTKCVSIVPDRCMIIVWKLFVSKPLCAISIHAGEW